MPTQLPKLKETKIDNKRFYVTPEGNKYPSITTVTGLRDLEGIKLWRARVGEAEANKISNESTTRGTILHNMAEKHLQNEIIHEDNYAYEIMKLFKIIEPELAKINNIYVQEAALYSDELKIAGRVDCVAEFNNTLSIIDFKTSRKEKRKEWVTKYFLQATAYAEMWTERTKIPINQIVIIMITMDGQLQLFIEDKDNWIELLKDEIKYFNEFKRSK